MLVLMKNTKLITMCTFFLHIDYILKLVHRSGDNCCNILSINPDHRHLPPPLLAPYFYLITHAVFFPESRYNCNKASS